MKTEESWDVGRCLSVVRGLSCLLFWMVSFIYQQMRTRDSEDPLPTQWMSLENMNLRFADMNAFQAAFPPKSFHTNKYFGGSEKQ